MKILAANFGEQYFPFELLSAFGERACAERVWDGTSVSVTRDRRVAGNRQDQSNVCGADCSVARKQDQPFDNVSKFANIARPAVATKFFDGVFRKDLFFPAVLSGNLPGEVFDEDRKIFEALAQRRKDQREDVDPVEEVAAKRVLLDEVFQIAVSGDHYANIDLNRFIAADALNFAFFQHAKELCLHRDRHIADFVEEQRATIGLFKLAKVLCCGAGEGAFFVAEEFGFDKFGWDGGTIQCDERVLAT